MAETTLRPSAKVKSDLAITVKYQPDSAAEIAQLRQEYKASRCAEYIRKAVDSWPPLTPEQKAEISAILNSVPVLDATGLLDAGDQ